LRAGALVTIPGARHEMMMERDVYRSQFWAAFDAFVPGSKHELMMERDVYRSQFWAAFDAFIPGSPSYR
jgi:alpha-beta hydrolase superfamily lysophospholipase